MGQVHHGSAITTAAIRLTIQNSQESWAPALTLADRAEDEFCIGILAMRSIEDAALERRSASPRAITGRFPDSRRIQPRVLARSWKMNLSKL